MIFLFYFFAGISVLGVLGSMVAAVRVSGYFRPVLDEPAGVKEVGLSMIVPIKGVNHGLAVNLHALVECELVSPVEFLFAMEGEADPAYSVCQRVQSAHPDKDIHIVLTGTPGERLGKQHNLVEAVKQAKYPVIGSMDADVRPYPRALWQGLQALDLENSGTAYHLPFYGGDGPLGGMLVAVYTNYLISQNLGMMALMDVYPLTIGSLWFIKRDVLETIGGFEPLTNIVSDDAALGRLVHEAGKRNVPISHPVEVVVEQLGILAGVRHLQKWIAMLRAEGIANYLAVALLWHPLAYAFLAMLVSWFLGENFWQAGRVVVLIVGVVRLLGVLLLNDRVYQLVPVWRYFPLLVVYEWFFAPVLFFIGLFRRTLVWGGRKYRIGKRGKILETN